MAVITQARHTAAADLNGLTEVRARFGGTALNGEGGRFEILAITAGEGNGWQFSEAVLRASLPLWEGAACFLDHAGWGQAGNPAGARSLRDLCGVCRAPRWSAIDQGVRLELHTFGPSGELVAGLGQQLLAETGAGGSAAEQFSADATVRKNMPPIGFSADIVFTARGRQVQQIVRVVDLSLVFNPARGGAFLRSLNGAAQIQTVSIDPNDQGGEMMDEFVSSTAPGGAPTAAPPAERQTTPADQAVQTDQIQQARLQVCTYLLDSALAAARLPAPAAEHLRAQFAGRVFTQVELQSAIDGLRQLAADLQGGTAVHGPRLSGMFTSEDQLQAAVDDLLGAPRAQGSENLRAARLSGIRELYMLLTGDRELYGGYYADRVQLATTANFTGLVRNAMNKVIARQWDELGRAGYDWWQRITAQEHFESLNQVTGVLVGTVGVLPSVAEGGEYTELKVGDTYETASFTKYGGYIPLTLELIDRDDTRKLSLYPRELAKAGLRRISALVAAVFSDSSGVGPTLADGGALFNATAVTTAGGHANLRTAALSSTEWENVAGAVYAQPMLVAQESGYYGSGAPMAIEPRFLLAPRQLKLTAMQILYPEWQNAANIHSENLQRGVLGDVVVVPEWTDASDWAAVVDPRLVPGIVVCERFGLLPEVFIAGDELSPAVFMNDEHRIKVRHFIAILVQDFRALHKSNVV